ncbi:acyltransferase family protein [Gimesia panareensis]|uniref:acyltransferase family protein n=1 Tax=Gimesia panareensis TaxID=2527978 RepID=UPI00118C5D1C|nr:acyltransferase family protein [Gimesia panareensis]QDU49837.1 O-acetyltransferase OatA [Gimesia panareensis]
MSIKYRPEIDGLRAIAVSSVVLYHAEFAVAGFSPFKGGFIGVDIFFVISGYLITLIILREIQEGTFSFGNFYERRARRILPALFTVMLVSIPFAWRYMLPKAMKEYAGSVLSSLAFCSNIWFWKEDSYTAEPSALKPFLHTWSLSVEEQFYVFFPIALILLWKYARNHITSVFVLLFLFSLQLANWGSTAFPDATFFLLPTRIWELLAGALLAKLELEKGRSSNSFLDSVMPAVGLFLLCHAIVFFDDLMPHPSFRTLLPVAGTMLIIWYCKQGEFVSNVLSWKPLVAIGLISYSFYLWHFPIFAFARLRDSTLTGYVKVECILLSLILSILTYHLVEQPARNRKKFKTRYFLAYLSPCFMLLVGTQLYLFRASSEMKNDSLARLLRSAEREFLVLDGIACHQRGIENLCHVRKFQDAPYIVNLGDSHASTLAPQLHQLANHQKLNYLQLTGAPFYFHVRRGRAQNNFNSFDEVSLPDWEKFLLEYEFPRGSIFVFTSRMNVYLSGTYYDNGEGGVEHNAKGEFSGETLWSTNDRTVEENILASFQWFLDQGHRIVLVYPVPETGFHVPQELKRRFDALTKKEREHFPGNVQLTHSLKNYQARSRKTFELFDKVPDSENVIRIYPAKILCGDSDGRCRTHNADQVYYVDDDHLSAFGAGLVVQEIARQMELHYQGRRNAN